MLGIEPGQTLAAIGGGGKMALLSALATEWASAGGRPLITTTTRIFGLHLPDGFERMDVPAGATREEVALLVHDRGGHGRVIVLGSAESRALIHGLDEESIEAARASLPADLVLVKADGARGQGLKAHKPTEPVIPARARIVFAVAGMSAWGQPISDETVHRAALFCETWGYAPGEPLDDAAFVTALSDPQGYRRTVPASARYVAILNQADSPARAEAARRIAAGLRRMDVETFWGDVRSGRLEPA
jgi:probable selenium-dependent hydroxylase accessory protein YqeC